ncbi:MAG: glucose PTS transporter subunit EIIB [Oscillospiraceae bacterium]
MITKFNYKTPGREDDGQEVKKLDKKMSDEMMATIIEGLGGADNIQHVDACFTRLRVKVKDKALVMPDTDWKQKTGANGVVQVADGVQIIYGAKADIYKNNLKSALNMD